MFGRRARVEPPSSHEATEAFWAWWRDGAARSIAARFDSRAVDGLAEEMAPRISAIDPRLAWEFGAGRTSRHQLTVTAEGDPAVRAIARRWLRSAPAADATWSFHDMRQPSTVASVITLQDAQVSLADVRVAARPSATGVDVAVFHPLVADLPPRQGQHLTFLILDSALGEEVVELWVDEITTSTQEPDGARPLAELPNVLDMIARDGMPEGEMGWTLLRGRGPEGPILATTLRRLSSVLAPELDQHVRVDVPYADRTTEGFPGPDSLDALRALEDHVAEIVGTSGRLVAIESSAGIRTLHFYVDATTPTAAQVHAATRGWTQGEPRVTAATDPGWRAVQHLRS